MTYRLGAVSRKRLTGIHPDLVRVVERAIEMTEVDFRVLEGMRTKARQKQLVAAGASKTMNSRHLTGHAVDLGALVLGKVRWDWPLYHKIAEAMLEAADGLDIEIVWGGSWRSFADGPHFELDRRVYP